MKISTLTLLAAVASFVIVMTLSGCEKKQEPTSPIQSQTETMETAGHEHEHEAEAAESAKETVTQAAETIEQTTCPVMGGKINKDIFTEYKGKKVYFCCPSCKTEFDKDPEKYLSKLPQFQN